MLVSLEGPGRRGAPEVNGLSFGLESKRVKSRATAGAAPLTLTEEIPNKYIPWNRVFAENLVGLGFLQSILYNIDPSPRFFFFFSSGKKWPKGHF